MAVEVGPLLKGFKALYIQQNKVPAVPKNEEEANFKPTPELNAAWLENWDKNLPNYLEEKKKELDALIKSKGTKTPKSDWKLISISATVYESEHSKYGLEEDGCTHGEETQVWISPTKFQEAEKNGLKMKVVLESMLPVIDAKRDLLISSLKNVIADLEWRIKNNNNRMHMPTEEEVRAYLKKTAEERQNK